MSYTQLIKDSLNILGLTIYFEENCLTKERYKGQICLILQRYSWNGNSFFDKFYKVQNFFPYAIPIVLDNEPPRM